MTLYNVFFNFGIGTCMNIVDEKNYRFTSGTVSEQKKQLRLFIYFLIINLNLSLFKLILRITSITYCKQINATQFTF